MNLATPDLGLKPSTQPLTVFTGGTHNPEHSNAVEAASEIKSANITQEKPQTSDQIKEHLEQRFRQVRLFSEQLCATLEPEDCVVQSMPDTSPTKWHLAHTSWFFETFLLKPFYADYKSAHPQYGFLFNSYYNAVGPFFARPRRGLISRPTLKETLKYRASVTAHITELLAGADEELLQKLEPILTIGINHEQQHQELMLTDIKHMFAQNPLHPVYRERNDVAAAQVAPLDWLSFQEGIHWIGHEGEGFKFDNEGPRHRVFNSAYTLASRLVTNAQYLAFMEDGGYKRSELWLSMGWNTVQERRWEAPLYWEKEGQEWQNMTLAGMRAVCPEEPVCHVSFFEADAFARWAGARLMTEEEWEIAATDLPLDGNFVENGRFHVAPLNASGADKAPQQMFGDVWEWTQSAYSPYPGYAPVSGALGEYNGKFMCNQYVLRGGSCATSDTHIRRTYRNFFPPDARWQFTGIRLAKDIS